VFFRNLAVVLAGPNQLAPPDYAGPTHIGPLPVSGNRFVALVGTLGILVLFYLIVKKTWIGRALRGAAQNRVGIQTAGVNVLAVDQVAFGIGVALAAASGALLAPIFLVFPENGAVATMKGFEIIVIGGLGSIPGSLAAGILLGLVESLGSVLISPSYKDVYGFLLVLGILVVRPTGLFGERQRLA
jgi:branched-chain amino acid transport system permease protein